MTTNIKALKNKMFFLTDNGFKSKSKDFDQLLREFVDFCIGSTDDYLTDVALEVFKISFVEYSKESIMEHGIEILDDHYGIMCGDWGQHFSFEKEDYKPEVWEECGWSDDEEEEQELMVA